MKQFILIARWLSIFVILLWQILFWVWLSNYDPEPEYDYTGAGMAYIGITLLTFGLFGHFSDKLREQEGNYYSPLIRAKERKRFKR